MKLIQTMQLFTLDARRLISFLCLLAFSSIGSAAIYQCVGADGKTAFQDNPCQTASVGANRYLDKTGTVAAEEQKHFLWKASMNDQLVYLFGSIHFGRPEMYPLPAVVMTAFNEADALMVEADVTKVDQAKMMQKSMQLGMYEEGKTLSTELPEKTWDQVVAISKALNVPEILLAKQKPWLASMTLASAVMAKGGFKTEYGIDRHFLNKAHLSAKPVIELESADWQLDLLASFNQEQQLSMLSNGLNDLKQGTVLFDKLVSAWAAGDDAALDKYTRDSMVGAGKDTEVYNKMLIERNFSMAKTLMKQTLAGKKYFVVVGAGHLAGQQGIPQILKQNGFTLEHL